MTRFLFSPILEPEGEEYRDTAPLLKELMVGWKESSQEGRHLCTPAHGSAHLGLPSPINFRSCGWRMREWPRGGSERPGRCSGNCRGPSDTKTHTPSFCSFHSARAGGFMIARTAIKEGTISQWHVLGPWRPAFSAACLREMRISRKQAGVQKRPVPDGL